MRLDTLPPGSSAVVVGYATGRPRHRFVEMGLVPGVLITALRRAPFGDPVAYAVMGSRIALRRSDAASVLIEPADR